MARSATKTKSTYTTPHFPTERVRLTATVTDLAGYQAPDGEVGFVWALTTLLPPAYTGLPLTHLTRLDDRRPASVPDAQAEFERCGVTNAQIWGGDVPSVMRGRVVDLWFTPALPHEDAALAYTIYIIGLHEREKETQDVPSMV